MQVPASFLLPTVVFTGKATNINLTKYCNDKYSSLKLINDKSIFYNIDTRILQFRLDEKLTVAYVYEFFLFKIVFVLSANVSYGFNSLRLLGANNSQ